MIEYILHNLDAICIPENLIADGQSRVTYQYGTYAIKLNKDGVDTYDSNLSLTELGSTQSANEYNLYNTMPDEYKRYFNPIYYCDERVQICQFREPCVRINEGHHFYYGELDIEIATYDLPIEYCFAPNGREIIEWLWSQDYDTFDMFNYSNFGITDDKHIIFIDYGRTNDI